MPFIKYASRDTTLCRQEGSVSWLEYRSLNRFPWLMNAFSTREGGVSEGQYARMNLSFTVGDDPEKVRENFRILGEAIGVKREQMVFAFQTHTTNVLRVGAAQKGMGVLSERTYRDVDGIFTNEPGVCLVTYYADCVPLYFVDPVRHAIALSHSGWRGSAGNIAGETIQAMEREFGTKPEDLVCCIGPCICPSCYEVSEDVAEAFREIFAPEEFGKICMPRPEKEGKYLLDLPQANFYHFLHAGVRPENISLPDLCTSCNRTLLHSHRATGGKRGGNCAFLMIREEAR